MISYASPLQTVNLRIGGYWSEVLRGTLENWTLHVSDDLLLSGYRERPGVQDWIGEHIGKYLLGAIPANQMLDSPELKAKVHGLVEALIQTQEVDGYLGTYEEEQRWMGFQNDPNQPWKAWDGWVHKYNILALLRYYDVTGWEPSLTAAVKAADCVIHELGPEGSHDINIAGLHVGLTSGSILEPIMLLYNHTQEQRYLDFAQHIVSRWEAPDGPRIMPVLRERGDVVTIANGKAYEMMSCFVGLVEYARVTDDREILQMLLDARDRIADTQRYPTGGMSNVEYFWRSGLLPEWASIETCVTFTWMQLNLRLYELIGDARALDLVEEAAWNQLLPAVSPQRDTWSYHLAMTGPKRFFKAWVQGVDKDKATVMFEGAPLTCCHTNGQRGLALVPTYAYCVTSEGALALNFYGASDVQLELPGAGKTRVVQQTDFPRSQDIVLEITPQTDAPYTLLLRRPLWASEMLVDGESVKGSDKLLTILRQGATIVNIHLGMEAGVRLCGLEARGKCVITYGPLVMTLDHPPKGLELDQVALNLGSGEIAHNLITKTVDGWPVVQAPIYQIPGTAVFEPEVAPAGTVTLKPVLFAGLKGNPGLEGIINGADVPAYNQAKQGETLFPEYRVQLPFFWMPGDS